MNDNITQEQVKSLFYYEDGELYFRDESGNKGKPLPANYVSKNSYKRVNIDGVRYRQHRIIYLYHHGVLPEEVDHINGIKNDNRIENLRDANGRNSWNTGIISTNKTGHKGVYVDTRTGKYRGQVKHEGKKYSTKRYAILEDAIKATRELRELLHGEFCNHG